MVCPLQIVTLPLTVAGFVEKLAFKAWLYVIADKNNVQSPALKQTNVFFLLLLVD